MATDTPAPTNADTRRALIALGYSADTPPQTLSAESNMNVDAVAHELARVRAETRQPYLDLADELDRDDARFDIGDGTDYHDAAFRIRCIG